MDQSPEVEGIHGRELATVRGCPGAVLVLLGCFGAPGGGVVTLLGNQEVVRIQQRARPLVGASCVIRMEVGLEGAKSLVV